MKKFSDYDEVKVNNFGERLKLGGHICKVLEAKVEEVESKNDGKKYEILVITFDIVEPDEQAGFYQRKFTEEAQKDALYISKLCDELGVTYFIKSINVPEYCKENNK